MTGLNEIENVYGETVEFYDLSALSQIGNKKIVLNKFADMVKDLDGIILDIGAGTGRYTSALMAEGYRVKAVELVRRNIEVFLKREPTADVVQGDARNMPFLPTAYADVTLLLGPLYHLIGDEEKLKALNEAKRVTKPGAGKKPRPTSSALMRNSNAWP